MSTQILNDITTSRVALPLPWIPQKVVVLVVAVHLSSSNVDLWYRRSKREKEPPNYQFKRRRRLGIVTIILLLLNHLVVIVICENVSQVPSSSPWNRTLHVHYVDYHLVLNYTQSPPLC